MELLMELRSVLDRIRIVGIGSHFDPGVVVVLVSPMVEVAGVVVGVVGIQGRLVRV